MNIKISVRNLVEFVLRCGSLDNRLKTNARAIDGVRAHQKLQKSNQEIYKQYNKEVYLKVDIDLEQIILEIEGRADGVIIQNDRFIIEEIKSTYVPLYEIQEDFNIMHWSQAKVYGYILCKEKNLESVDIQLSYYNLDNDEVKSFVKTYTYVELKKFVYQIANDFKRFALIKINHDKRRNDTIKSLNFPFESFREGQLKMARACYGTIRDGKRLFVQAPTGIGKTMSTIFPSIKAVGENIGERIFYLTARNINRTVAEESVDILRNSGLDLISITIYAKEKICLKECVECNSEKCEYAAGFYDKINNALFDLLSYEKKIDFNILTQYSMKYKVCPFELSLEIIKYCDFVICDYNYVFDPKVYLRRIIDENAKENIILVDEAHNLIDRARESFSANLNKSDFLQLKKDTKGIYPAIYRICNKINKYFIDEGRECESQGEKHSVFNENPKQLCKLLRIFVREAEEVLVKSAQNNNTNNVLLDTYFDANTFLSISELYGEDYMTYIEIENKNVEIKLFCVDPSNKLARIMDNFQSVILFSATLTPMEYYIKVSGGNSEDYRLRLESPFPKENLVVYADKKDTRYSARSTTINAVCRDIIKFISDKKGNYMIFFPSYNYLDMAKKCFDEEYKNYHIIYQKNNMNEKDKNEFLNKYEEENTIGCCVIGAGFSEAVDLPGDKLIGAVIVGVGYPKISLENEIIKDYFKINGQNIAYVYPGINKVLQAGGRVIRSQSDKGRILLIDDRYFNKLYAQLIPENWYPLHKL